jgi:hypothetical protein
MRNVRWFTGVLLPFVLAALSAVSSPATAAPEKQFTIDVSPATLSTGGAAVSGAVILSNETPNGNSSINSSYVYAPAGLTITGPFTLKTYPGGANFAVGPITTTVLGDGRTRIALPSLSPIKPKNGVRLTFNVQATAGGACGAGAWSAQAWTGSSFSGDTFNFLSAATMAGAPFNKIVNHTTTVSGESSLAISSPGNNASTLVNVALPVTVTITNTCLASLAGVQVTLSKTAGTAGGFASANANTNASGVASFSPTFTSIGNATLSASASGYPSSAIDVLVFDGTLACGDADADALLDVPATPGTDGEFSAGTAGSTGYIAGLRGVGDDKSGGCTLLKYTLTNNIASVPSQDPAGNQVPTGYYSFSFDPSVPNPVVAILSTYAPEWANPTTGLPDRQTKVCEFPCPGSPEDFPSAWTIVPACLGTAIAHASIPSSAPGACLASEGWVAKPGSCTSPAPSGTYQICLQVTSIVIMGTDPVFGR